MVRPVVALAVAALISGCGAVHPLAANSSASPVPWLPLAPDLTPIAVPSPQAVPVPPGTPICAGSELEGTFTGSNGATGHVEVSFGFASAGTHACYVEGTPAITLLDAAGHDLGFKNRAPYFPNEVSGPALVLPGQAPSPYQGVKDGQADLTIDWVSQPEACPPGEPASHVSAVRMVIAKVGSFTFQLPPMPAGYACQGVGVGALADPPLQVEAPAEPPVPDPAIVAPTKVKAGEQLKYMVILTNQTKLPIDLRQHCPNYEEELFADLVQGTAPLGGKHFYALNCKAAGLLEPSKPMSFAMVLQVPADAAPGRYILIFNIGISNAMTKIATTAVVQIF
ncbi:MAG TPA: DUF4232 domain-containing protein [Candidatus Dormibacteraeota bacterium]|nr:DUF4232 domain-containing protein [Candidatus Dormibacteraeota bacterium]